MAEEVASPGRRGVGASHADADDDWDQAPSTAEADDGVVLAGLAAEVGTSLARVKPTRKASGAGVS